MSHTIHHQRGHGGELSDEYDRLEVGLDCYSAGGGIVARHRCVGAWRNGECHMAGSGRGMHYLIAYRFYALFMRREGYASGSRTGDSSDPL